MTRRTRLALVVITLLAATACGQRPAPPPSPMTTREESPLRPLTSRDGPASESKDAGTAAKGKPVEGEIRVDARIRDKARPEDVLYVIARNSSSRQIVAVRKEEGVRFPFSFRLSPDDVMMAGVPFEGPFDITARLSRSGDAIPQTGDLEGTVKGVIPGSQGVTVIIDNIRP